MKKSIIACVLGIALTGCAGQMQRPVQQPYQQGYYQPNPSTFSGWLNQQPVQPQSHFNVTGCLVGGAAGGLIGSQMGKGKGKTAMTAVGAIAGAMVGCQQ